MDSFYNTIAGPSSQYSIFLYRKCIIHETILLRLTPQIVIENEVSMKVHYLFFVCVCVNKISQTVFRNVKIFQQYYLESNHKLFQAYKKKQLDFVSVNQNKINQNSKDK